MGMNARFDFFPWRRAEQNAMKYPRSREIMATFNEGLRRIRQTGEYVRIVKKYK